MTRQRDDFSAPTKNALAARASYVCSFQGCNKSTIGPSDEKPDAFTSTGVAAHICAASPGGRRYDQSMTAEQRSNVANGIWLCSTCSVIIDRDDISFTVQRLHEMKRQHENSRSFDPDRQKNDTADLVAIGYDIIALGTFMGVSDAGIAMHIRHFLIGDAIGLVDFVSDFASQPSENRFVVVNELGEGRAVSAPPTLTKRDGCYDLVIPVLPRFLRTNATSLGRSFAQHHETGDWFVENGHIASVTGVETFAQHLSGILGLAIGDNVFHPKSGSRVAAFWADFSGTPLFEQLLKLEIARLSSVQHHDRLIGGSRTQLLSVNRVRDVQVKGSVDANQRLTTHVVLDVEGVGRWERDIRIFIHNAEQLAKAEEQRRNPDIARSFGLL